MGDVPFENNHVFLLAIELSPGYSGALKWTFPNFRAGSAEGMGTRGVTRACNHVHTLEISFRFFAVPVI